jgi:hypothetical protein
MYNGLANAFVYHDSVLIDSTTATLPKQDPECLATLKHYARLMPMGQEERKPIFFLILRMEPSEHYAQAVRSAYDDFKSLTQAILNRMHLFVCNTVTLHTHLCPSHSSTATTSEAPSALLLVVLQPLACLPAGGEVMLPHRAAARTVHARL